ncbi:DUF3267 domain-containing protein [Collinsella sp. An2]|uniref:DUF3267 domain-containing protein n=1 Tax=Collinsella sp. An2 TaxID=1965585 RepID=UPI000B36C3FC|nr:DUF3267 domain-containing protein [Collinsella sp. An2]OUP09129.1 hypothetical protein B5F33_05165 [Collinsella sp. An2]
MTVIVLAAGIAVCVALTAVLAVVTPNLLDSGLRGLFVSGDSGVWSAIVWLVAVAVGTCLSLLVHEGVHAALFKVFAPHDSRVTFGANWKMGMIYACAEGIVYTRRQYMAVSLAPSIVVTLLAVALGVLAGCPVMGVVIAVLHLSGCTGDWGYARAIAGDPNIAWCEDTTWGVQFFDDGDAARTEEDASGRCGSAVDGGDAA